MPLPSLSASANISCSTYAHLHHSHCLAKSLTQLSDPALESGHAQHTGMTYMSCMMLLYHVHNLHTCKRSVKCKMCIPSKLMKGQQSVHLPGGRMTRQTSKQMEWAADQRMVRSTHTWTDQEADKTGRHSKGFQRAVTADIQGFVFSLPKRLSLL